MRTSELQGAALDWAVAKSNALLVFAAMLPSHLRDYKFSPSTDWAQGGPIIEREAISMQCFWPRNPQKKTWQAAIGVTIVFDGPTPLIAAMRCYVASKLGEEVEVPEDLQ